MPRQAADSEGGWLGREAPQDPGGAAAGGTSVESTVPCDHWSSLSKPRNFCNPAAQFLTYSSYINMLKAEIYLLTRKAIPAIKEKTSSCRVGGLRKQKR